MTLFKMLEKQKRKTEVFNMNTLGKILDRKDIKIESATFDKKYQDEIMYHLGRINRC